MCLLTLVLLSGLYGLTINRSQTPELTSSIAFYDFGSVKSSGASRVFTIKNTSNRMIHISGAQTTCSCATALTKPGRLAPDETVDVEVQFHPFSSAGITQAKILLLEEGRPQSHEIMTVKGKSLRQPSVHPPYIYFSEVDTELGQPTTQTVRLIGCSKEIPKVTIKDICEGRFAARVSSEIDDHASLHVTFLESAVGGLFDGTAFVELDFQAADRIRVPIRGHTKSADRVAPSSLSFLTVSGNPKDPLEAEVLVDSLASIKGASFCPSGLSEVLSIQTDRASINVRSVTEALLKCEHKRGLLIVNFVDDVRVGVPIELPVAAGDEKQ